MCQYSDDGPSENMTYKCSDGPLDVFVSVPYPEESNHEQDNGATDHAPVEQEPTTKTVDGIKG